MFNSEKPSLDELPGSAQLLRSTLLAGVVALVVLVTVVLPAEYGFDPTGVGRVLGLTEMGEIKHALRHEAEEDDHHDDDHSDESSSLWLDLINGIVGTAHAQDIWKDQLAFALAPGESAEVKLVMKSGAAAEYVWVAEGGRINFDLHAHGDGESVTYEKGRGEVSGEGVISAAFAGQHGWFWRNRDKSDVSVSIKLRGDYSKLIQD